MNTRSVYFLAATTALVAAVAAVTLKSRESAVRATPGGTKLFPDLPTSINDVATIELLRKDGRTTLQRTGEVWGLAEKQGFPVEMAAVRKNLIGISELTTAEAKTDDPKKYAGIGVDEPGVEGSTSTLVTLRDANGREIAALIVGKERQGKSFSAPHQVYVRKAGEARSWLANGELDLKEKSTDWLDKKILEVKRDRVRAVEITHADGEVVLVDREEPTANDFGLHDIPEGKELSYPTAPGSVASALEWLNFEDVVPAAEVDMSQGTTATAKFSAFDGLVVQVVTKNDGEKTYARFEAAYEEPPAKVGPPSPSEAASPPEGTPPDAEDKAVEKPDDDGEETVGTDETKTEPEKPKLKSVEEVRKEVEELNSRLSPWTFVIPNYNKTSFQKKKSELLKDKAPPPAPSPDPATSPAPGSDPEEDASGEPPKSETPPAPEDEKKPDSPPESKPPGGG